MKKIVIVTIAVALLSTAAMAAKGDRGAPVSEDDGTGPGAIVFGNCHGPKSTCG